MITIKYTYIDGYTMKNYFLGQYINIGHITDNMQQCIKVEQI